MADPHRSHLRRPDRTYKFGWGTSSRKTTGPADLTTLTGDATVARPALVATVPVEAMRDMQPRVGIALPAGDEGAGTVIAAGSRPESRALLGKTVAVLVGGMYAELRGVKATDCLVLPEGTTAEQGASCFVNPLTVLGFLETTRVEGHSAIVHTAAASNLGLMLNRACLRDGVELVSVVRTPEQAALVRRDGAVHVVDSSVEGFREQLTDAIAATGATVAFDAVGGGPLAGTILSCMERALLRRVQTFDRYGSAVHKQIYVYGGLQPGPIKLQQDAGKAWSVSGWLLTPFLQRMDPQQRQTLRERVVAELTTTFASHYSGHLSLQGLLDIAEAHRYLRRATGEKYLVCPQADGAASDP